MKLSDRKKKILQIVVDDYIDTAVPVSSKLIADKYSESISSATVRSELSALEELGYLTQVHTSSGRIPSNDAYKLYVSELMVKDKLSVKELNYIKKIFTDSSADLEHVIKNTVKVISELTDYTSVGMAVSDGADVIEAVKLFRFKADSALLLIVTTDKLLKDNYVIIPKNMTDEQLDNASNMMSKVFKGKPLCDVGKLSEDIAGEFKEYKEIFINVIEALKDYVENSDNDVVLEGEDKILNHPEYADVDKIKNFLSTVTSKDKVIDLLRDDGRNIKINVKIGLDEYDGIPQDCSVVSATYTANGKKLGTYGVIGPVRMDYQKVFAVLENVGKILENLLQDKS